MKGSLLPVWIIAVVFTLVGGLVCLPKYYKLFRCRGRAVGRLVQVQQSYAGDNRPLRARYEYYVDGVRYEGATGWSNYAVFSGKIEYKVRYDRRNPQRSFISMSGMYMNCAIGTVFFLTGIGVFFLGVFLQTVLF